MKHGLQRWIDGAIWKKTVYNSIVNVRREEQQKIGGLHLLHFMLIDLDDVVCIRVSLIKRWRANGDGIYDSPWLEGVQGGRLLYRAPVYYRVWWRKHTSSHKHVQSPGAGWVKIIQRHQYRHAQKHARDIHMHILKHTCHRFKNEQMRLERLISAKNIR